MGHCREKKKCDRKCKNVNPKCKNVNPSEPGPNDVGFIETDVELVNGISKVVIWYPVKQGFCPRWKQNNVDASKTYKTFTNNFFTFFEPSTPFEFPSVLKAEKDAEIKSGRFPLNIIIQIHWEILEYIFTHYLKELNRLI